MLIRFHYYSTREAIREIAALMSDLSFSDFSDHTYYQDYPNKETTDSKQEAFRNYGININKLPHCIRTRRKSG